MMLRMVSWLTPKSAASERRLLVAARARISASSTEVSFRGRCWYRREAAQSSGVGTRKGCSVTADRRRSGTGKRSERAARKAEHAQPIPVASAISCLTLTGLNSGNCCSTGCALPCHGPLSSTSSQATGSIPVKLVIVPISLEDGRAPHLAQPRRHAPAGYGISFCIAV